MNIIHNIYNQKIVRLPVLPFECLCLALLGSFAWMEAVIVQSKLGFTRQAKWKEIQGE